PGFDPKLDPKFDPKEPFGKAGFPKGEFPKGFDDVKGKDFPPPFKEKEPPNVPVGARTWQVRPRPSPLPVKPPALDADKVVRTLPAVVEDVAVGGGGRFLLLALPKMRQVAVFDANEGRVVKYLPVGASDIKLAAGMTKLLVALPESRILQRWDLTSLTREVTVPLPTTDRLNAMA